MGGWSVYCAICGGPFSSNVEIDPEETGDDDGYYRDKVLRGCNLEWLDDVCGLGINSDAPGNDKSFLSGVGEYWDYVRLLLARYHNINDHEWPHVFPFHPICYKGILLRCIHQGNYEQIRRDILVDVKEDLSEYRNIRLELNYGEPEPPAEQVWPSIKGQEVLVVNPVKIPQLDANLAPVMESFDKQAALDQDSQSQDIFNRLPAELRHWVFDYLPAGSIIALKAASFAMHTTTLPGEFWKHRLRSQIPWLWEIHDIDVFQSQDVEDKASKLLLDIEKKSQYTSENDDYIFGLANRRRIWGVCEQIRTRYFEKLQGIANTHSSHS
ncbi:hypothetical protein N7491_010669 [Penicillium cf. griseofulvum]|uniref:F-box domain-containing protein n=1 Tax=Penicillium cf. griseofulvum TaxID=2972120 RepID=A0A9W9T641_9EURO|nr:hypothetical protein N7472_000996 [Penicillium cf. griseofulvum]KAJ5422224.1 hypothetical protein N7491_010669 [Penicillium cf. griseofulvum]KAJ5428408.1 hypothetical protein N7445_009862 [Penicillium cf. griseofulvum]